MRVVLDTNILVSAILGKELGEIVDYWDRGAFRVIVSAEIMAEYTAVLARPKFKLDTELVVAIISYVERKAEWVSPTEKIKQIQSDPKDDIFIECAVSGKADYIVSGDNHLLALSQFRDIPIVTPRHFLNLVAGQTD